LLGGLEIHPAIVHFPIALTTVGALAGLLYIFVRRDWLRWFAPVLLSLALMGAVAAYFSGEAAKDRAEEAGVPVNVMEQHEGTGLWALGTIGMACLLSWAMHLRRRGVWISAFVALVAAGLVLWNGHLGGKLVFVHGAGRVNQAHPGTTPPVGQIAPQ
jgi:uncharacterized membrane protein